MRSLYIYTNHRYNDKAMKDFTDDKEFDDDFQAEDDALVIEEELEDIEENSAQKVKQLKEKLKESERQKMEYLEDLQRAKAEFLNGKRRLEEERLRDKERAITNQIEKLLPLCDSFYMAMSNKEAWDAIDATWRKGMESVYNQLQNILTSYGVKEINPQGETFDPAVHDAMTNVPVADKKDHHKIIGVIQNGFTRIVNGKEELIRPARVTVGEYTE